MLRSARSRCAASTPSTRPAGWLGRCGRKAPARPALHASLESRQRWYFAGSTNWKTRNDTQSTGPAQHELSTQKHAASQAPPHTALQPQTAPAPLQEWRSWKLHEVNDAEDQPYHENVAHISMLCAWDADEDDDAPVPTPDANTEGDMEMEGTPQKSTADSQVERSSDRQLAFGQNGATPFSA